VSANRQEHPPQHAAVRPLSEPLFADAFENAPHGMALIAVDGSIMHANGSLCRMLGFTKNELRALNSRDITHADDLQTEAEQNRRLAAADIGRYELVQRYLRKGGEAIWVRVSVSATRRNPPEPVCFIAQVESIAPQDIGEGDGSADAQARLGDATLSAFHEIGNSLTPLMLNAEMIIEETKKSEIRESAHQIFKAARRIAFTLRRLRGTQDIQPVAYLGESRMLDLRLVAPPTPDDSAIPRDATAAGPQSGVLKA
jgi:PAS domain S-box-containing protein